MNWYASCGYSFMKYPGWNRKEAAGEGAGRHTRGRVCSPGIVHARTCEDLGRGFGLPGAAGCRSNSARMMTQKRILTGCAWLALAATTCLAQTPAAPAPAAKDANALGNAVILIVRHAEKPESGMELTPAGVQRAEAYTNYFRNFTVDSKPLHLDCLIAAADSKNSHRSRLTLEPLSKSLGLPLDLRYADKQAAELAGELQARPHGKQILIAWHHGQIPTLIEGLGGDPAKLLPGGKWPDDVFSWVIQLRYDGEGRLMAGETKCIHENLMPWDEEKKKD